MGNISALLSAGMDSFANLFDVKIEPPSVLDFATVLAADNEAHSKAISVRAVSVTLPSLNVGTYDAAYKGVRMTRPNAEITGERVVSINFRIDARWDLFNALLKWKHLTADPTGGSDITFGFGALDEDAFGEYYGRITVTPYKSISNIDEISEPFESTNAGTPWVFDHVWVRSVAQPAFSRDSATPALIQAEFAFGKFTEPAESDL